MQTSASKVAGYFQVSSFQQLSQMTETMMPEPRLCLTRQMSHMLSLRKHQGVCVRDVLRSTLVKLWSHLQFETRSKTNQMCFTWKVYLCSLCIRMFVYLIFLSFFTTPMFVIHQGREVRSYISLSCCVVLCYLAFAPHSFLFTIHAFTNKTDWV